MQRNAFRQLPIRCYTQILSGRKPAPRTPDPPPTAMAHASSAINRPSSLLDRASYPDHVQEIMQVSIDTLPADKILNVQEHPHPRAIAQYICMQCNNKTHPHHVMSNCLVLTERPAAVLQCTRQMAKECLGKGNAQWNMKSLHKLEILLRACL